MCLACHKLGFEPTEEHAKLLKWGAPGLIRVMDVELFEKRLNRKGSATIQWHNGEKQEIYKEGIDEIISHALAIVATFEADAGHCNIWAIQWPNDYKPTKIR